MQAFELAELLAERRRTGQLYREFLRVPSLSVGVYVLPAGGIDPQQPHTEDEVYYVVSGRAVLRVGDKDQPVAAGSILFVEAGVAHHFYNISEELTLLVFFASRRGLEME